VRARAPSSGAVSARRCSIGRMREYVLRRRSRVLPRRESGARAPMLGAGGPCWVRELDLRRRVQSYCLGMMGKN